MAYIEMNANDARELEIAVGDVVGVYNDYGSTYAVAYPDGDFKRNQTFMVFGYFRGVQGDVTTEWTDRNVVPYYKARGPASGAWAAWRITRRASASRAGATTASKDSPVPPLA
jgi:anaerobic selenocysteine-containing dehydrogenase